MVETQYVIFRLGEDLYGATIKDVQEIILPKSPPGYLIIQILSRGL